VTAVRLAGVTKRFGDKLALDAVSFAVPRGCICGVIGPNGSGKTTTLRLLADLLRPDAGSVEVLGETALAGVRDRVAYLPEERGLYRRMKVRDVLEYLGRLKGATRAELRPRIKAWLARLELAGYAEQRVEALSKGMAQKLQLAAALVSEPDLLILDEPLSGFDPLNAELAVEMFAEQRAAGRTILLSTHDMAAAERVCDRIAMIFRGRVVLDATLAEIRARYAPRLVRVACDATDAVLRALPGAGEIRASGDLREIELTAAPEVLLRELAARASVSHFELVRPTLRDVFVAIARPSPEEARDG
jgi:ABC-2 type transport system ATP-binding protein